MRTVLPTSLCDPRVAGSSLPGTYGGNAGLIGWALERVAGKLGWSDESRGPLGRVIPDGAKVLVKPNFVLHENEGPWGLDPLVTHASVVRAVVDTALRAGPSELVIGDAPLQGCDFDGLLHATGLSKWAADLAHIDRRFKGIRDFRRTTCGFRRGVRVAAEGLQSENRFVLFDLGCASLLEPITDEGNSFRVTCYDPRLLVKTHARGRHRYLIAKEVIEADVVINLPKLKTHKKAGITFALKNLVGINGNKEYLPHHRIGGSRAGGDCYPNRNVIKRIIEYAADRQNMASSFAAASVWHGIGKQLDRVSRRLMHDQLGVEGSWSGNDTVWRMCLDLNRIILYGCPDGGLADHPQRRVIHVADAIVAGQGDGPLSPQPLPLGLLLASNNAAAMDWIGARLLGYDPTRVSIAREAFGHFKWPLTSFRPDRIEFTGDWAPSHADGPLGPANVMPVIHPVGWRDAAQQRPATVFNEQSLSSAVPADWTQR